MRIKQQIRLSITCAALGIGIAIQAQAGDVIGKLVAGYQGWFSCAGDGSAYNNWNHWSPGVVPAPGRVSFDLYPDCSQYTGQPLFNTSLGNLGNGSASQLYSAYVQSTVNTHFYWMQQNGIDCAALQRFGSELDTPNLLAFRNQVSKNVMNAAQTYGRKFYIMYDISGWTKFDTELTNDWKNTIVGSLKLTSSSAYAKENNKPVVCVWGIGFSSRPGDSNQCVTVINTLKAMGCYVIGGVPRDFRNSTGDSRPAFQNVYKQCNMLEPWLVGGFSGISGADSYASTYLANDKNWCSASGIAYQPVLWAGYANHNENGGAENQIPRLYGTFMWEQFYNVKNTGISSAYVAMFDEYNESTAIEKAATDSSMLPTGGQYFLTLNADGVTVSSDFYLRLVDNGQKMLKGTIGLTKSDPTSYQ